MKTITLPTRNKKTKKLAWNDEQRLYLLKNSKTIPVSELAKELKRTEDAVKNECYRIGCGYITHPPQED